jgi:hypothetical protein
MIKKRGSSEVIILILGMFSSLIIPIIEPLNEQTVQKKEAQISFYEEKIEELENLIEIDKEIEESINNFDKYTESIGNQDFQNDLNYQISERDATREKNIRNMSVIAQTALAIQNINSYEEIATSTSELAQFMQKQGGFNIPTATNNTSYYFAYSKDNNDEMAFFFCKEQKSDEIIATGKGLIINDLYKSQKQICTSKSNGPKHLNNYKVIEIIK